MEQDEQGQQEARDAEQHLQDDLENFHVGPFDAVRPLTSITVG
jgi:hypothetical protein